MTSQPIRMCKTRYLGPTTHRGARIKAIHLCTLNSITLPWRHEWDAMDNHERAAGLLLTGKDEPAVGLRYCSGEHGEVYWLVDP